MPSNGAPKVLVIALDGATFDLIRPWTAQGHLPLFKQLMEGGAWGELASTIPPITPVAWLTFMTGKNPGKHGVFDFFQPVRSNYRELIPVSALLNREPSIWKLLSHRGHRVCVLNVPMTYPPEPVNGVVYAGVPTPADKADYSYPPSVHWELLERGWDLSRDAAFIQGTYTDYLTYLKELATNRTEAALHLLQREAWDFFMVHYLETDQVLHSYWRFWEEASPAHPLHDAMLRFYQHIETQMAKLLEHLGPDSQLLILSDHGMGPVRYHVHLNGWLAAEGFLRWKRRVSTSIRRYLYRAGITPVNIYGRIPDILAKRFSLGGIRAEFVQIHPTSSRGTLQEILRAWMVQLMRIPFLDLDDIDWANSDAYSTGTTQAGFIYVNLEGREPMGKVHPGLDYERIRHALRERLEAWRHPCTGQKVVERVYFKEELYTGPHLDRAPDVIALYREADHDTKKGSVFLSLHSVTPIKNANATHRPNGMLIAKGAAFRSGPLRSRPHIIDIAPLILYLLDEAIPEDFEGQLPVELLNPALLSQRPCRYGPATATELGQAASQDALSEEDLASIVEQLRRLGYVE